MLCRFSRIQRCVLWLLAATSIQIAYGQKFRLLHTFNGPDGENPTGNLLLLGSSLYGTTAGGGATGYGTVFKVDLKSKTQTVLYSFPVSGAVNGGTPLAGVISDAAGNLYGTTHFGGYEPSCQDPPVYCSGGVVFQLAKSGSESVLYAFKEGADGANPDAGLLRDAVGNFYGTTSADGAGNAGTVIKLTKGGQASPTLYAFSGDGDGASPQGALLLDRRTGNLFGTTFQGASGFGTVFRLNSNTAEFAVLYTFTGGADGGNPAAGLVADQAGYLYGTATTGGSNPGNMGDGVIFRLKASTGEQTVLHTFGGHDGANPSTVLSIDGSGNLYGTTSNGGSRGAGTLFKLDSNGNLTTLHNFTGGRDGAHPSSGLIRNGEGHLYGVTSFGGVSSCFSGCGTVFEIIP
jgi:uncharacterized repeat protein (TIGR03803 family)